MQSNTSRPRRLSTRMWDRAEAATAQLAEATRLRRHRSERQTFSEMRLFDARHWRGGHSGPPFGYFNAGRMRWWDQLLDTATDETKGVVLSRRQLSDMVYLAGRGVRIDAHERRDEDGAP